MINAFSSEDMEPYYNQESKWSHHPFYSIRHLTTDIYTKLQRLTILFIHIVSYFIFISLLTRFISDDAHLAIRLIVYPIGALFWSIIPVYISAYQL